MQNNNHYIGQMGVIKTKSSVTEDVRPLPQIVITDYLKDTQHKQFIYEKTFTLSYYILLNKRS